MAATNELDEGTVLENRRQDLVLALEGIDVKRREIQARIMLMNRQRNMPKSHIARMKAESAELLQKRSELTHAIATVKREIAVMRQLQQGAPRQPRQAAPAIRESVSQAFVRVAQRMMPEEMFNDIMDVALEDLEGGARR